MTLRRADARFALPDEPSSALVLGNLDGWRTGLAEAGIPAVSESPDLVVAPASSVEAAIGLGAEAVIAEGRGSARALRKTYANVVRLLPVPNLAEPEFLLPLGTSAPALYAIDHFLFPGDARWKAARNAAVKALIARGRFPDARPVTTVAARDGGPPFLVSAARRFGVPDDVTWFLGLGRGDALTRAVFHLFPADSPSPEWVLKFARAPGYRTPFDRDERGLALASRFGGTVTAHTPTLLGRFESGGLHASVETAAVGETLTRYLMRTGDREAKLRAVSAVAEWAIALLTETRQPAQQLGPERARLADETVPRWPGRSLAPDLVDRVGSVDGVLQHNDLGCWNIVRDESTFTVLDWESARECGLPLWDLLYFLTDAFIHVDGRWEAGQRDVYVRALFRGETPSSTLLFEWLAAGAAAARIEPDQVEALATLCWLHHGLSYDTRSRAAEEYATGLPTPPAAARSVAEVWLSDPELTPRWVAWRRFAGLG